MIRFIDVKPDYETPNGPAKEITFPNGIYSDIHELIEANNTVCKNAESHFYFELQKATSGKVSIKVLTVR